MNCFTKSKRLLGAAAFMALVMPAKVIAVEIEEVVVTAQRRVESVQDVPLSVTACQRRDLTGIKHKRAGPAGTVDAGLKLGQRQRSQGLAFFARGKHR